MGLFSKTCYYCGGCGYSRSEHTIYTDRDYDMLHGCRHCGGWGVKRDGDSDFYGDGGLLSFMVKKHRMFQQGTGKCSLKSCGYCR